MVRRKASLGDVPILVELRKQQLLDEGEGQPPDHELVAYFAAAISNGSFVSWIMEEEGDIIATSGVCFYSVPPACSNPTGRTAYITNMYTKPAYRRRGIATELLGMAISEARARGCRRIWLHASAHGKSIYQKNGFLDLDGFMALKS